MSYWTHLLWATFEVQYFYKTYSKRVTFLDFHKWPKTKQLLSKTIMNLFYNFFLVKHFGKEVCSYRRIRYKVQNLLNGFCESTFFANILFCKTFFSRMVVEKISIKSILLDFISYWQSNYVIKGNHAFCSKTCTDLNYSSGAELFAQCSLLVTFCSLL